MHQPCPARSLRRFDGGLQVVHEGRMFDGSACGADEEPSPPPPPPPPPPPSTILLNNSTTGGSTDMAPNQVITFKDSGDDGDYSSNEYYTFIFNNTGGQSLELTFNDFTFEHSTYAMYDRLGLIVDGQNASIPWMQSSSTSSVPWGASFEGSAWNSSQSSPGWIVPLGPTRAILLGWDDQAPTVIACTTLKFLFFSDSSVNRAGWDITIKCLE